VFSICAKASERTQLNLRNGNLGVSSVFNLTAGTIVSTGAGQTAAIIPLGNNWYRCSISFTSTVGTQQFLLGTAQAGNVFYTGDGYSGIYIWGAQLEAGAFPTSYIPTVASQVTRGADSASMTGVNFSSWYRQDAGSFYSEFDAVAISATTSQRIFEVGDGTVTTPSIDALISGVATSYFGAAGPFGNGATVSANTFYKFASARAVNDFACVRSGGTPTTNSSAVMPQSYTQLNIGNRYLWDRALNGHIKKLSYYPKRLSNTELQALTA
jgi:hypothetical protein